MDSRSSWTKEVATGEEEKRSKTKEKSFCWVWGSYRIKCLKPSNPCSSWSYSGAVTTCVVFPFLHHFALFLTDTWVYFWWLSMDGRKHAYLRTSANIFGFLCFYIICNYALTLLYFGFFVRHLQSCFLLFIFKVYFGLSHQLANSLMTNESEFHLMFSLLISMLHLHGLLPIFGLPLLLATFLVILGFAPPACHELCLRLEMGLERHWSNCRKGLGTEWQCASLLRLVWCRLRRWGKLPCLYRQPSQCQSIHRGRCMWVMWKRGSRGGSLESLHSKLHNFILGSICGQVGQVFYGVFWFWMEEK